MNYYNPYFNMYPYIRPSLFSRITGTLGKIKFGSILSGTQKTLNIINQTIPIVKQAKPVLGNAKTMFKVMNEFRKVNTPIIKKNIEETKQVVSNVPKFFI